MPVHPVQMHWIKLWVHVHVMDTGTPPLFMKLTPYGEL